MKKLLGVVIAVALVSVSSFFVMPFASATDVCSDTPVSSADFYVETSQASWLMSQSCVDSDVIVTMPQGSVMHVIGKTEGWHKLLTEDGHTGWMWEDYVTATTKTFNPVTTEEGNTIVIAAKDPMYDIAGHKYEDAIWYVYNNGIVNGYPDGAYKPDDTINRAELLKIIVKAAYDETEYLPYSDESCFDDVDGGQWYTSYICFAKDQGIVEGYGDGTFKPAQEIIFVEALKIATVGFGHEYVEGTPWYKDTVDYASSMNVIPLDITAFNQMFNRGQMADMITRMLKYQESQTAFEEYVGDSLNYKVTYQTIEAGLDVEGVVGTGQCISTDAELYDDGISMELSECTTCMCDNGNWLCTGLCLE